MQTCADLELCVRRLADGSYTADLRLQTPDSAVETELATRHPVPLDVDRLRQLSLDTAAYGRALMGMVFAKEEMRLGWSRARDYANGKGIPLRVCLNPGLSDELHALRWEAMYGPDGQALLALSEQVIFSRILASPDLTPVLIPARPQLRALVVVANPTDLADYGLAPVAVAEEVARVSAALHPMPATVIGDHPGAAARRATLPAIVERLRSAPDAGASGPHILYLVCHGALVDGQPYLWLEHPDGTTDRVRGDELITRVRDLSHRPLLAVLATCQSAGTGSGDLLAALGPQLAQAGIPAVLAMQGNVPMATVEQLMPAFFRELQRDGRVDRALAVARAALHRDPSWWMPVLFLRVRDGRLWRDQVTSAEQRRLDAATPSKMTVGQASELWVQICLTTSLGFIKDLPLQTKYGDEITKADVRGSELGVTFPVSSEGQPLPAQVRIEIQAPDFEVNRKYVDAELSPGRDLSYIPFTVTPRRARRRSVIHVTLLRSRIDGTFLQVGGTSIATSIFSRGVGLIDQIVWTISSLGFTAHSSYSQDISPQVASSPPAPQTRTIATGGGDYAEGGIDKRQGIFAHEVHLHGPVPVSPAPALDPTQAIPIYLRQLRHALAQTDVVPIANAYASADTRDYVTLQVRSPRSAAPELVFASLAGLIAMQRPAGLLVVGDAGSGKSHTLRYAALALAQAWPGVAPELRADLGCAIDTPLLPIYVQLQDLPRCRAELRQAAPTTEPTLLHQIDRHQCRLASDDAPVPATLLRSLAGATGVRCLFLLDGLDEVDEAAERQDFQRALLRLQREHPEHVYVVASRPLPDQLLSGAGFTECRLLPLQPAQMRHILVHWYRADYGAAPLAPEVERQVEQQAADLLATILADQDLGPMAANPLFLTAMARLALSDLGLPRLRGQKFRQLVDLLLEWRRNRLRLEDRASLFAELPHRAALTRLAELAACMLALGREELTLEAFVHGACGEVLPPRAPEDALDADVLERLLRSVVRHTGLLTEQRGRYRFTFGFRDYLAARAHTRFTDLVDRLFARRAEPAWRTTIVLAVGDQAASNPRTLKPLFAWLLDDGVESTLLAAEALIEALDGRVPELEPERRRILARLRESGADPELIRRLEPLDIADSR